MLNKFEWFAFFVYSPIFYIRGDCQCRIYIVHAHLYIYIQINFAII